MSRLPLTYEALGVLNDGIEAVAGATVTFYEVDGVTLLGQPLWNQAVGGAAQANPTTTGSNGATPTFWLDNQQTIVVKWTAPTWQGVTDTITVGDGGTASGGGVPADGSITTAKLAPNAVTSAKVDATVATRDAVSGLVPAAQLGSGTADGLHVLSGVGTWIIPLTVQNEGTPLVQRSSMDFVGAGVVASDDPANSRTLVTINGITVQDEGTALALQPTIDFVGAGVTATNDNANSRTVVTIPGGSGGATGVIRSASFKAPVAGDTFIAAKIEVAANVTGIDVYVSGGTSADVNVSKNGVNLLASDFHDATTAAWQTSAFSAAVAVGDTLIFKVTAQVGNPPDVVIVLTGS